VKRKLKGVICLTIWLELNKSPRKDERIYSGNQIVLHTGSEDVLTANVFGIIKNLNHGVWFRNFLCETLHAQIPDREFRDLKFYFWKRYPSPREYNKKEGPSEVDVTLELDSVVFFVEAKYRSGLATGTTYDEERDQIVRNLDVGLSYSKKLKKRFFLLIITNEDKPPALLTCYRKHPAELARKLPYQKGLDLTSCVAWTNWREIMNTLKGKLKEFSLAERRFVNDLLEYLQIKISRAQ